MKHIVLSALLVMMVGCGGASMPGPNEVETDAAPEPDAGSVEHHAPDSGAPDAMPDASPDAPPDVPMCVCSGDLSYASTDDLLVTLTVQTTAYPTSGYAALLDQRGSCGASEPGWDLRMNPDGTVTFQEFDGSGGSNAVTSTTAVPDDGQPHIVTATRSNNGTEIDLYVNSNYVHLDQFPGQAPMALSGRLATLQQGTDTACSSVEPFPGTLSGVCVAISCPRMR